MTCSQRLLAIFAVIAGALLCAGCDLFIGAEERIARAEKRIAAADDRGALIEIKNAVQKAPDNVRARLLLAELSLRLGDPNSARREIEAAIAHGATQEQTALMLTDVRLAFGEGRQVLDDIDAGKLVLSEPARSTFRGLALLQMKQSATASEVFKQALKADPQWSRARFGLVEALVASGQSDTALEELDNVLVKNPQDPHALLARGTVLVSRGEFAPAVTALTSAREHAGSKLTAAQYTGLLAALTEAHLGVGAVDKAQLAHSELAQRIPSSPLAGLLAARIAMVRQDYATAVAEAQKVVNMAPQLASARMLLGVGLLAQGNLNQAEAQLAQVVQLAPENAEARKLLARVNLQLKRPDVAMQVLSPLQQGDDVDAQLDALLGMVNLQQGDNHAGIARLERSLASRPNDVDVKLNLAAACAAAGQHERARTLLDSIPAGNIRRDTLLVRVLASTAGADAARAQIERIVAANSRDADVLTHAAALHAWQGDFDRARAVLSQALKHQPTRVGTLVTLARVESAAGNVSAARDAAQRALSAEPDSPLPRFVLAELAARSGEVEVAIQQLEEIRAKNADAAEVHLALARAYLQQRKTREANAVIGEIERLARGKPALANALGQLYLESGRFEAALEWLRSAASQSPGKSSYLLDVARAQLAMSNNVSARETLEKLLAADPQFIPAVAQLVMLDLRERRREAAQDRLAKLVADHPGEASVALLEGDVAMTSGSYTAAATAFDRAYRLAPSGTAAIKAYRARELGQLSDAPAPLVAWLQRHPDDSGARLVLAEHYVKTSQHDRAITQYELAARGISPNAMALNNLAWLYQQKGDSRSEETAKRAYTAAPQVAAIADTYGWILVEKGRPAEGLPILQKAAQSVNQPQIRFHYAAALAKVGQTDAARKELNEIVRSVGAQPIAEQARQLLGEIAGL